MMKKLLCTLLFTVLAVVFVNAQSITVTGLGNTIPGDGSNIPVVTDDTNFGSVDVASGGSVTHTFTMTNTSASNLLVGFNTITNSTGNGFSNGAIMPPSVLQPTQSRTFTIVFDPNSPDGVGLNSAIVSIDVNILGGGGETFLFNVDGTGTEVTAPDIDVLGNGQSIISQDTSNTPSIANDTDFGDVNEGSFVDRVFTIQNTGNADLLLNGAVTVLISGGDNNFTVQTPPGLTTLTPTGITSSTTFTVRFTPSSSDSNPIQATILIENNDPDISEQFFLFDLTGNGIAPQPEIDVQGLATSIPGNGSNTPSVGDDTNFGQVGVDGGTEVHTFTILNTGDDDLTLDGTPIVQISGGDGNFTVTQQPALTTIGGPTGSTTFEITFDPSTSNANPIQAVVLIENSDADEGFYLFNIQGEGVANEPEIDLLDNVGAALASGGSVSFPDTDVTAGSVVYTFTIENNGTDVLTLTDPSPFVTIGGTNAGDFTLTTLPVSPIAVSSSTTFAITFNPSGQGSRTASVTINNDDSDEGSYTFTLQGNGIDANVDSQLMITQYYEGLGANDNWIEVKNVSTTAYDSNVTSYFLAMYSGLAGTTIGGIVSSSPTESVLIPSLLPGEVALFSRNLASVPSSLGTPAQSVADEVCNFDGNDIILISTSEDDFCYDGRIDLIGEIGSTVAIFWGQDISLIKGCGTTEAPSEDYTGDYITLTLDEVDNANASTNLALGTQTVGPSVWNGTSWSNNQIPDKTKETIINGSYTNGTFESCNLTINPGATVTMSGTDYVVVDDNLTINGTFTIGDTASLITTNPTADISGSITKEESSTGLNNYRDFTYWSSPVLNPNINITFSGVDTNRIFSWDTATSTWNVASGSMARGIGYISEAPNGATQHSVDFVGEPNNGTIPVFLRFNDDGVENTDYNLIGNPYPSAIDIRDFINLDNVEFGDVIRDNSFLGGTIYLWTHNTQISGVTSGDFIKDDYAAVNLSGGIQANSGGTIPTFFIGSGQGFFVRTTDQSGGGTRPVFFQNSMRRNDENSTPFFKSITKKSEEEQNRIWLDVVTEQGGYSQILLGFFENATDGIDRGYDGSRFSSNPIKLYSKIGDAKYAIQGLGSFDQSKSIDLGLDTRIADRTYKISINNIEGVLKDETIYLVDNELNVVHDLKQGDYEFEVIDAGNYTNRFTLKFNNSVLSTDDVELNNSFVVINEENGFRLKSNSVITNLKIYDIAGRLLIDKKPGESEFTVKTSSIRKGTVLILNATLEGGAEISKKAIKY